MHVQNEQSNPLHMTASMPWCMCLNRGVSNCKGSWRTDKGVVQVQCKGHADALLSVDSCVHHSTSFRHALPRLIRGPKTCLL